MLVALTEHNKKIVLHSSIPSTTLKQLRKTTKFFCPQCKEPLVLKIGAIKIPHFAHAKKSRCESYFSEGESANHLMGKEQLFSLFQSLKIPARLEPYLSNIMQRPDILIKVNNNYFAIEYQCSPISTERLKERNDGYKHAKIKPVWIPLTPSTIQTTGITKIHISKQLQQFKLVYNQQQYIMSYNPLVQQFFYISNLLFVAGNRFIANVQALPLNNQQFPFYIPKPITKKQFHHYLDLYTLQKKQFLKSRLFLSRKGVNDLFLRSIYELRLSLQSLPTFIGVPLPNNWAIEKFSVEWQMEFLFFLHQHRIHPIDINNGTIRYFLKWAKIHETKDAMRAVQDYCIVLKQLAIEHVHQPISKALLEDSLFSQFLANETIH